MIRVCIKCETEFNDRLPHNKPGKINECGVCAKEPAPRYVAMRDNGAKSGSGLTVFKRAAEIDKASAVLKAQNAAGFGPNIGIGSTTSTWGQSHDC